MSLKPRLQVGLIVSGWVLIGLAAVGLLDGLVFFNREPNSGIVVLWQWVVMGFPAVVLLLAARALARHEEETSEAPVSSESRKTPGRWRTRVRAIPVYRRVLIVFLGLAALGVVGYALLADSINDPGNAPRGAGNLLLYGFLAVMGPPMGLLGAIRGPVEAFFHASTDNGMGTSGIPLFVLVYYIYFLLPLGLKIFTRHTTSQGRWLLGTQVVLVAAHALLFLPGAPRLTF